MIKSMTGYGRGECQRGERKFTVEMKAVNHRYFDVSIRMPKTLSFFEAAVRTYLKGQIQRGKIDVFITCEDTGGEKLSLLYNERLAAEYVKYVRQMAESFTLEDDLRATGLARFPEVLTMEEQPADENEIWELLKEALETATAQFQESRAREGAHLKADILEKLSGMRRDVAAVEERSPQILSAYREKLNDKVKELLGDTQMEENRLAAEVILFADKICTDEETVRLASHIDSMCAELEQGGGVGRKLDFIAQEMNREANTILSKANDLPTSNLAINLKTEIEKVREQIQNIE